jgi:hypothetical protein
MIFFPLLPNKDVFVTRIEASPEYLLVGSSTVTTGSFAFYFCGPTSITDYLVYRDYYNPSNVYHTYYYDTPGNPLPRLTASITFYNSVDTTTSRAHVAKMLDDFYFMSESLGSGSGFYGSSIDILSIPRAYFGKSFRNFVSTENDLIHGQRTIYDDGNGNVYAEYSTANCGPFLVGKAFYNEGIIFVRSDPLLDSGHAVHYPWINTGSICCEISFTGSNNIYVQNIFCHLDAYEANFSQNATSYLTAANGEIVKMFSGSDDRIFVTGIGLYDENYKLVAVAKTSKPIRKLQGDKLLFKLRLDIIG